MTETYLWAALGLMHLLGTFTMYALVEYYNAHHNRKQAPALDFTICFLAWEVLALWVIFEKTKPV